ncbi:hypothetical protein DFH09DRAFT_1100871 [Mycena vulgaris]|nr:hypothetical protein DFH09DRAFT_1100871 [Mycena vulgaris]
MVVRGGASGKRGKLTVKAESESRVPVFGRVVPKAEVTRVIRVLPPSCQCALQTTADLSGYPHLRSSLGGKIDKWSPTLQVRAVRLCVRLPQFRLLLHTAAEQGSWNALLPSFVPDLFAAIIRIYLARAALNVSNGGTAPRPQHSMDPSKSKSMHRAQKKGLSSVGVRSSMYPSPGI